MAFFVDDQNKKQRVRARVNLNALRNTIFTHNLFCPIFLTKSTKTGMDTSASTALVQVVFM